MSENNRWDAGNPDLQEIRDVLQSGGEGEGWKRQVPVSANSVVQPKLTAPYSAPFTTDAPLEGTGNGADEVDCADCGWHGSGNDLASGEDDGHGKRAVCPRCGADEEELSFAGLSRASRTEVAGAVPKPVDLKARMDWAESILKSLPEHEPTYAIIDLLNDYDSDDRDEILHSIRAYANGRATQALFTQYVPAQIPAADAAAAPTDERAAFEAEMLARGHSIAKDYDGKQYEHGYTNVMWKGWMARASSPNAAGEEGATHDVRQLADWLLTDPQTGESLHFAGPLEPDFLRFSRVKLQGKSGAVWTLSARLEEGYLTSEERLANIKRAAREAEND